MMRAIAALNTLPGAGAKPASTHSDSRSGDPGRGDRRLAKRENNPDALITAADDDRSSTKIFRDAAGTILEFDLDGLVHTVVAVFRNHPHINNVLTHICGGQWERIGQSLHIIFNPLATLNDLSPLAQNIVELICAERGVTGRILNALFPCLARQSPATTGRSESSHPYLSPLSGNGGA